MTLKINLEIVIERKSQFEHSLEGGCGLSTTIKASVQKPVLQKLVLETFPISV